VHSGRENVTIDKPDSDKKKSVIFHKRTNANNPESTPPHASPNKDKFRSIQPIPGLTIREEQTAQEANMPSERVVGNLTAHVVKNAGDNDALSVNEPEDSESSVHAP